MNELNLKFSVDEVNLILSALGKEPYVASAPLISKITMQAQQQLNPNVKAQQITEENK